MGVNGGLLGALQITLTSTGLKEAVRTTLSLRG